MPLLVSWRWRPDGNEGDREMGNIRHQRFPAHLQQRMLLFITCTTPIISCFNFSHGLAYISVVYTHILSFLNCKNYWTSVISVVVYKIGSDIFQAASRKTRRAYMLVIFNHVKHLIIATHMGSAVQRHLKCQM